MYIGGGDFLEGMRLNIWNLDTQKQKENFRESSCFNHQKMCNFWKIYFWVEVLDLQQMWRFDGFSIQKNQWQNINFKQFVNLREIPSSSSKYGPQSIAHPTCRYWDVNASWNGCTVDNLKTRFVLELVKDY